jgi:hypothetical protein
MNRKQTIIFLVFVAIGMGVFYFQTKQKFTRTETKPNMKPFYHWADSLILIEKRKVDSLNFAIKLKDMEIVETKKYYEKKLRAVPNWNHDSIMVFFANRSKNNN